MPTTRASTIAAITLLFLAAVSAADRDALIGEWIVDLRPTPDAQPYLKTLQIDEIDGDRFTGSFYDTPFDDGVINDDWGSIQIAFTTRDGRTSYHHSGEVNGDRIDGRTHAPGRQMLSVWSATKTAD